MPLIRHHSDPANVTGCQVHTIPDGTNLLDWLIESYGTAAQIADGLPIEIILNGRTIASWDGEHIDDEPLNITLGINDEVKVVARPGSDPYTIINIVVAIVAAVVAVALAPTVPGDAGQGKSSPNNQLQSAQNSFRPGEGIPEIFGNIISYPDFIQPSAFEYVNNLKIVRELFCIGVGEYDVANVKTGSTLINDIDGSSFTVYNPGDVVPSEQLVIHTGTNEVDGQVLKGPNDESIEQGSQIATVTADGVANTTITLETDSTFVTDTELTVGDYLRVLAIDSGVNPPVGLLEGFFEVLSITGTQDITIELDTTTGTSGTPSTNENSNLLTVVDENDEISTWLGWFTVPGDEAEDILFRWQMPQGIRKSGGGRLIVNLDFEIEQLDADGDPTGIVYNRNLNYQGNTLDPQFVTTRFNPDNTPGMIRAQYRARMRRNTDEQPAGGSDQIKVEDFVSVTPYSNPDFGNVTLLYVERRATTFAVAQQQSKINADVTRKLPTYNRTTGVYDQNNLQATRSFADAVAYNIIVGAGRQQSSVDMETLYQINDGLPHPELGYFDFSFDDFDVSLGERVKTIAGVARVAAFRDGALWQFSRDEVKPVRSAMFNRRAMVDRDSQQNIQLVRPDDKDSVALTYVDPEDNVERTLYRAIDYDTGVITSGNPGTHPLEINLAGCRNNYQAENRADVEIRRIAYQRRTVNDIVHRDGLLVGLMERVGWVDPNDTTLFDGEILGISGNNYETSERFTPAAGVDYFVYVTDNMGNPSNSVPCTARTDTEFGFVAAGLSGAFLASGGEQVGSRYFIGSDSDLLASDFLVNKRVPQADGTVQIELTEYIPAMYERDVVPPPQQAPALPPQIMAVNSVTTPDDSTVTLSFNADGTFTAGAQSGAWVPSTPITNGALYEIRFTLESGDTPTGVDLGEWLSLSEDRALALSQSGVGSSSGVLTIEIRQQFYEDSVTSNQATMSAIVSNPVSLPSTISLQSIEIGGTAVAAIDLYSDGRWETEGAGAINPQTGEYTTSAPGVGSLYEARATLVSGEVTGPLDQWLQIDRTRDWFNQVNGSGTKSGVISLEIREISNNANITSSTVTLTAQAEF